jgi:ABC-type branched-subunit amino acid transport system substrate-binding protein
VQLAVEQANQTSGKQVGVVVRGRVGQWGADAVEAARMVLDDGVSGLVAPPDGAATHLALQVSGRTAVPVVSLCADSSVSRTGVPWMLRIVPRTSEESGVVFSHFKAGSKVVTRWAALVPPARAGREISNDLAQAACSAGCVIEKVFEVAATNRAAVVDQVIKANPQGLLVWLDPEPAGTCVRMLKQAGFSGVFTGPSRLQTTEFVATTGQAMDGFALPGFLLDDETEKRFRAFQAAFQHQYHREADAMAAYSFDAAALLVHILRTTEPHALARSFPVEFSFPGVSGILSFDVEGNRKPALQLLTAQHGRFVPLSPGQPR